MRQSDQENPATQTFKAVLGIRDLILSGELDRGERLSEPVLAKRLGLSRTPLRAALAQLVHEGLLVARGHGGHAVRSFSTADVIDAIELRGVLEGTAARIAAERGADLSAMAEMREVLERLDAIVAEGEALDFDAYVEANAAFHDLMPRLSGSALLSAEVDRIARLPFAGPSAFLRVQPEVPGFRASLAVGQAQHRSIVAAISAREGARAEALAREHARLAKHNLVLVMQDRSLAPKVPGLRLVAG